MKKVFALIIFLAGWNDLQAQVVDPRRVAKDAGVNHANNDINTGINDAADKIDNGIKGMFKKKKSDASTTAQAQSAEQHTAGGQGSGDGGGSAPASMKAYSNYDFVPGDRIVFEDNFADDQDGEFPSHWNLGAGQAVLNMVGGREALLLTDGNYAHVSPLNKKQSYLTDTFTIEFDTYTTGGYGIKLYFYGSTANALAASGDLGQVALNSGPSTGSVGVSNTDNSVSLSGNVPSDIMGEVFFNGWHHVAIAYRHNQMKVYVDQYRILTVPNFPVAPRAFDIEGIGDKENPITLSNFRVANGGSMNMYTKKFSDAKIVTHGINFDVDKSSIRPESMGTLNAIKGILNDNPGLRFEIDGHTDNSGAAAHNLQLSQQRAEAVKAALTGMGIDGGRLTTKGLGDTKPMSDNSSAEGKANNRRVEFIRL